MDLLRNEDDGVFELITELCNKTALQYCSQNRVSHKHLMTKMRSQSYEIILRKSSKEVPFCKKDPIAELLTKYFISQQNIKNVAEYKRSLELKKIIDLIRKTDFGENKDNILNILRCLLGISNTVQEDLSSEMYKSPFTFGMLDEMLPKPQIQTDFGSPQPYPYFPSFVFELPYSLRHQGAALEKHQSQTYAEYTVESFESKSVIADKASQKLCELKTFRSPMSLASLTSTHMSPYSETTMLTCERLTSPRDLKIPKSNSFERITGVEDHQIPTSYSYSKSTAPRDLEIPDSASNNMKVSLVNTNTNSDIKEVLRFKRQGSLDIWEVASHIDEDKAVPNDIWDVVSKMPEIKGRQLLASSTRELNVWHLMYDDQLSHMEVISEHEFIRHVMYLIIGIETKSFPFCERSNCFYMKDNLLLEGISQHHLKGYVSTLLVVGTYYRRLYKFAFTHNLEEHFNSNGLIYEAAREVIRQYLLEFRLQASEIFEEFCKYPSEENCMPTLLQILFHLEPLKYEIETVASIFKLDGPGSEVTIPHGAELMSYLFNEISLVTHKKTASTMFTSLISICKVYFKFIERFIFEGELDDLYHEFFIRKDSQYVNCQTKKYWDKGFHIAQGVAIPEFLTAVAKVILLCGKSLRLLKLCNPSDPLVLLISSDHPSVKCCASFEQLERQQEVLDVYRTRCLFVSGEPVTFDQILLKREAEKKAFAEMASIKQAETMEKIIAERKRLAQLIIAEKQHSLRVLEAAMAEAKAAKRKAKEHEKKRNQLEHALDKATEEVDSKLKEDERNKIMQYYSKLNMEVEKSKIHMEWKIKRLQLDQSRIQLLSTEERNLKREKLELEHKKNEDDMAMSVHNLGSEFEIKADDKKCDGGDKNINDDIEVVKQRITDLPSAIVLETTENINEVSNNIKTDTKTTDVLSALCNAAKSIFGVSWKSEDKLCDNEKHLDAQGNIMENEINSNVNNTSNSVIGDKLHAQFDRNQYFIRKQEALMNKHKVMVHEMGQIDKENNLLEMSTVDEENNINEEWNPYNEAKKNKIKVLGATMPKAITEVKDIVPKTEAQREALLNKQKVLGVEYNVPVESLARKEPLNIAQEEAVSNKLKILNSQNHFDKVSPRREISKRSNLTLNLKPVIETVCSLGVTPNTGAITPAEFFPRLDLETPTADVLFEGPTNNDHLIAQSETNDSLLKSVKSDKKYVSCNGFNFSIIDDDAIDAEVASESRSEDSPDNTPLKKNGSETKIKNRQYSCINLIDGSYSLEDFDPFGVKTLKAISKDYFSSKMDLEATASCYTHPSVIMDEVKKSPYKNIFASHSASKDEEPKMTCENIATLTACLQRSIMLPLTYQMEVVNNAILTYFLMNLDMYEHLRSLKDYFFLMDGEFSRSICRNLFMKLGRTVNPQELLNFATLHNILDKALGSSISHIHKFSENLSFSITESPLSFQHSSPDVLQCLSLTYCVSWPLNIILSQEALLRYAKVFQFLIKMRRVFWILGEDFEALKLSVKLSKQKSRILLKSPQYISTQIYRHIMASMIRALDNYIVTTCILSSWTEFENDLKKARTLDDLYECHVVYIKKVLFRCLLNNRSTPVMKLLNDIFTIILKFSRLLKAGEWHQKEEGGYFTHSSFAQLEELFHLFEKVNKYLHKVITKLMECGYQRHLVELLTMVNFNGYYDFDKAKDEQNSSIQSVG